MHPQPRIELGPAIARAIALQRERRFAQAEPLCRAILQAHPGEPSTLYVLGVCLLQRGELVGAEEAFASLLKAQPKHAGALTQRGIALQALGRQEAAVSSFDRALEIETTNGLLYWLRARALITLGRDQAALQDFEQASTRLGRKDDLANEWLAAAERVLAAAPDDRDALAARAFALAEKRQWAEALLAYGKLLDRDADNHEARAGMAGVFLRLGQPEEALAACERVLEADAANIMALNNRAMAMAALGRYVEAVQALEAVVARDPDNVEAHWNHGLCLLVQGRFTEGWPGFEWRWKRSPFLNSLRALPEPIWNGAQTLAGKTILLHAEQGFGDTIQFARFAPVLAQRGARVILGAHRPLKPLFETIEGVSKVLASGDEMPPFDLHCPLMSVPAALGTTLHTIPATVPYVRVDKVRQDRWKTRLGPRTRPRVGLTWSGSPQKEDDARRSMPLKSLAPLLTVPAEFFCLNKFIHDDDRDDLQRFGIRHDGDDLTDFAETAALTSLMDLVISVDTAIAHLAGALARPLWLLLPDPPEYRWMLDREDSPWYPTARLFRQRTRGDWQEVIARVASELVELVRSGTDTTGAG